MSNTQKQPALVGQVEPTVRPAAGVVLDESGWPVLTGRGNEDAFIKHRRGERVYSQTAVDALLAAERERCAVLAETSHPHDWAFIGAAIRNSGPNVRAKQEPTA